MVQVIHIGEWMPFVCPLTPMKLEPGPRVSVTVSPGEANLSIPGASLQKQWQQHTLGHASAFPVSHRRVCQAEGGSWTDLEL